MHSAACPSCGTRVEFDFLPVAGHVWCPTCQKLFSPSVVTGAEPPKTEQSDTTNNRDGKDG
jgi:uncharacterized Zn finger protein (UPF0148 family)